MMLKASRLLPVILGIVGLCSINAEGQSEKQEGGGNIYLADPTIMYHEGIYYLYGTSGHNSDQGFQVYTSADLTGWEGPKGVHEGFALRAEDVYGTAGFWAPQVFFHEGLFYMAYTANEHIAIATSDNPLGPFVQQEEKSITAEGKQIDPYVFFDEDGKTYLYHVRLQEGNRLFVAEMTDDLLDIKPETLQECISAVHQPQAWENTAQADWTVTEGPTVLKHDGRYYFFYSANDFRNPDYAVGYAIGSSPYGPWEKYSGNPIISRKVSGMKGSGHGDFFRDETNRLQYVMHTHHSDSTVSPRKTALIQGAFNNDRQTGKDQMRIDQKSFRFLMAE